MAVADHVHTPEDALAASLVLQEYIRRRSAAASVANPAFAQRARDSVQPQALAGFRRPVAGQSQPVPTAAIS